MQSHKRDPAAGARNLIAVVNQRHPFEKVTESARVPFSVERDPIRVTPRRFDRAGRFERLWILDQKSLDLPCCGLGDVKRSVVRPESDAIPATREGAR